MNLTNYLKAGFPTLYLLTHEVDRAVRSVTAENWQIVSWDCLRGFTETSTGRVIDDVVDPLHALKWLVDHRDTVMLGQNFHHFLTSIEIVQEILNSTPAWKAQGSCLVIVGPKLVLPLEIEKYFTILEFQLPNFSELQKVMEELGHDTGVEVNNEAVEASLGLTEFEAETAYALSLVKEKRFSTSIITDQKSQMIKRSGLMEFWPPVPVDQVGGLDCFKQYLANRKRAFETSILPKPKALLLVGIPGTGKSLSCKAAASIFGWPLIRLDISALKGSLVGESERHIREATSVIDAFGKAVVWLDEIDKTFSGVKSSGQTDGGTVSSMFGHFLTWMQETVSPVLVMATANDLSNLPPEFLRAGRFDALFFVDMPTIQERQQIINIMNHRYGASIPTELADKLEGWTGAEIEQLAKDSLFDGIETAFASIVPLSKTMKEEINGLKDWAKTRARKANASAEALKKVRRVR